MLGIIGVFSIILGIGALFTGEGFGFALLLIIVGIVFVCIQSSIDEDDQMRHKNDYGKVAKCYRCGSTKVYLMTYDDKRDSINFWGAHSPKVGKRYHCDNCGNEW